MSKKLHRAAGSFLKSIHSRIEGKRQADAEKLLGKGVMSKLEKLAAAVSAAEQETTVTAKATVKPAGKRGRPKKDSTPA